MSVVCFFTSDSMGTRKSHGKWNAHKIRESNHSLVSGIPDELDFFPESLGYEQCGKNVAMTK